MMFSLYGGLFSFDTLLLVTLPPLLYYPLFEFLMYITDALFVNLGQIVLSKNPQIFGHRRAKT